MTALRKARTKVALLVAAADIAGVWSLEEITHVLSRFADGAIDTTVAHLLATAAKAGELNLSDPLEPCKCSGFTIIGMGKLGAYELNYSSDIDIIALFDQEAINYSGEKTAQECYVRLTRDLVQILQSRTADGYVFRTDLRLRPDTGSSPLAMSMEAAESYYESVGQNWERAALIKARPVAGDLAAGREVPGPDFAVHLAKIPRLRRYRGHSLDQAANTCPPGARRRNSARTQCQSRSWRYP